MMNETSTKLLIVDDLPENLRALNALIRESDRSVYQASSGEEALALLLEHDFALAILDVQMPEMDGFAATRSLRNDPETKNIPVVLVTAKDQKADKAWGQMLGAKGYITKPYTDAQVLETIKSVF